MYDTRSMYVIPKEIKHLNYAINSGVDNFFVTETMSLAGQLA